MKLYGSYQNRLEENRQFVDEIKVGTGVTEYSYTDRDAWEVIAVKDQKHVTIRRLDAKRIDDNGPSECQEYEYISNEKNYPVDVVKRGKYWYTVAEMTAEDLAKYVEIMGKAGFLSQEDMSFVLWAANFDHDKVRKNGKQTKYHKMNISFGKAERYYDYSF